MVYCKLLDLLNSPYFLSLAIFLIISLCYVIYCQEVIPSFIFVLFAGLGIFFESTGIQKIELLKACLLPLLLLVTIAGKILHGQRIPIVNIILMSMLVVATVLSAWLGGGSIQDSRAYLGTIAIAFVVALCPDNEKTLKYLTLSLAIWGLINLLAAISQWAGLGWVYRGDAIHTGRRVQGLMGTSTAMGVYFVISLNAVHILYYKSKTQFIKISYLCLGAGLVVGLLGTLSRASFAAWLISFLFIQYRLQGIKISGVTVIIFTAAFVYFVSSMLNLNDLMLGRFAVIKKDPSAQERLPLIQMAIQLFETNPLFGIGLSQGKAGAQNVLLNAHNTFIQKIMENGIIGFSLFCIILWKSALGLRSQLLTGLESDKAAFSLGLLATIGAILINGLFHDFSYLMPLWVIVGIGLMVRSHA